MARETTRERAHRPGRVGQVIAGVLVVVLSVALAVGIFYLAAPERLTSSASPSPSTSPTPPLLGGVPENGQDPDPVSGVGPGAAVPFVTTALLDPANGGVTVRAFVPGLAEEGGVCRAILMGDGEPRTVEVAARIDVATTTCDVMTLTTATTTASRLSVIVEYESPTSSGRTQAVGVEVQ